VPEPAAGAIRCPGCGAEIAPALLTCPACRRLTHAERLTELAAAAEAASLAGQAAEALGLWRSALELLPQDAAQAEAVRSRIDALSRQVETAPRRGLGALPKWLAPLGVAGLLLWKFKFALAFVLTKGKLLLLGLTKSSTFFSMLLALGAYWSLWGWKFALGFVLMIYVHEMGHVSALRSLGIKASAPMFVPGLGAFVRLKQYPASPREDARVGLAGPVWGLGAALATWGLYLATGQAIFAGIAHAGAVVNLFNLIPVWQLDGSRGMRALARRDRAVIAVLVAAAFFVTAEGLLLLLALAAAWRAFERSAPETSDRRSLVEFALLILALGVLCAIEIPGVTPG
jgi:Zn-dependent protease